MNDRSGRSAYYELEAAARMSRLPVARVRRYVRVGLVRPSRLEGRTAFFGEAELARLRRIRRLAEDLGLNAAGVEIVLRLVDEIEALQGASARDTSPDSNGGQTWHPRRGG
jgi:MerR family transcriptional regulator, heat shock protein HspR